MNPPGEEREAALTERDAPGCRCIGRGGHRRSQSVFYLDGSENMGGWRNQALQMPNPDTVPEVQIVASSASAEFGKQPGMSMNVITKSGTNAFRGTAFFATHWSALNANTWSANAAGAPKPADQQRWWAGTAAR